MKIVLEINNCKDCLFWDVTDNGDWFCGKAQAIIADWWQNNQTIPEWCPIKLKEE